MHYLYFTDDNLSALPEHFPRFSLLNKKTEPSLTREGLLLYLFAFCENIR